LLAALLHQQTGSWVPVLGCAIAMLVLKPRRARFIDVARTFVLAAVLETGS
jgi:hypothetical protein